MQVANRRNNTLELALWLGVFFSLTLSGQAPAQVSALPPGSDRHPLEGLTPEAWQALHIETDLVAPPWVVPAAAQQSELEVGQTSSTVATLVQPPNLPQESVRFSPSRQSANSGGQPPETVFPGEDVHAAGLIGASEQPLSGPVLPGSIVGSAPRRPRVLFDPAVPTRGLGGSGVLRPVVTLVDSPGGEIAPTVSGPPQSFSSPAPAPWGGERLPTVEDLGLRRFLRPYADRPRPVWNVLRFLTSSPDRSAGYDVGVARERLPFAHFELDSSQPLNNYRLRFDAAYDWEAPDRAEYLWSGADGRGPSVVESSVDYQDVRFLMEMGGKRLSVGTELPMRFLNPTDAGNTAGLGDVTVTTKTVLVDGSSWQLTQILRTQMPTGTAGMGRGNGHTSMEPGLIARYKWSEDVLLHSEFKFWFPLGADPEFSGQYLRYGLGIADVMIDTDDFAVLRSLELVAWSFLSGQRTVGPLTSNSVSVEGENVVNLYPGFRIVRDGVGDFGMFEVGCSSGLCLTERHLYRSLLRLDLRWSY